jgi:riboflavin kinase/FMN adenylyltransferase
VTIGNFDGVHLGHQKIISRLAEQARRLGVLPLAITFDPHPVKVLRPAEAPPLILTLDQRLAKLAELGCAVILVLPFDRELARLEPEGFVQNILLRSLRARMVVVGANFRFGYQQKGDTETLRRMASRLDFGLEVVPPVYWRGQVVSSSAIRAAVHEGRTCLAGRLLGRPFSLTGSVTAGTGQGRRLVVPTLNLDYEQELVPARGVYATRTVLDGHPFRSVTNVGVRPTFDGSRLTVESHLLDFAREVSGGRMEIFFYRRLRSEQKFANPAELRTQVLRDIARVRRFFGLLERSATMRRQAV